jgi:hypothetical protein
MNDAQRYRMNAAECLSAAERCGPAYRDLTLAIAASWLSLARHQEAMDGLLAIWTEAHSGELSEVTDPRQQPPDLYSTPLADPVRGQAAIAWAAARRRGRAQSARSHALAGGVSK